MAKSDLKRVSFWISRHFANFKQKLESEKLGNYFFCETGKTRVTGLSESTSESSYCDVNLTDLGRLDVDS